MSDRALVFIDGNNWYHSLKRGKISNIRNLDYAKISRKLVGPRDWHGTRYYIGRVSQTGNRRLYAQQRSFLDSLQSTDKTSCHLGRLEKRQVTSETARQLKRYLAELKTEIDGQVFHDLIGIAESEAPFVMVEKAVDVMLAVDMTAMAIRDEYDTAYLLSADGDFTPAVKLIRQELKKKIFAVSASYGAALGREVNAFIHLKSDWFVDCYR